MALLVLPAPSTGAGPDPSILDWSDPINLTAGFVGYPRLYAYPNLAGGSGPAEVAWWAFNDTHRFIDFTSVAGPGAPWGVEPLVACKEPVIVFVGEECGGLRIGSRGRRTVVLYSPNDTTDQILTRGWDETTFHAGALLSGYDYVYALLVAPPDRVYLASVDRLFARLYLRLSTDGGYTFGDPVDISLSGKGVGSPQLALAPDGRIGACWEDYRNGDFRGGSYYVGGYRDPNQNPDVFATVLQPDLATVPRPVRVDDSIANNSYQVQPTCAFLPDGRMFVAWSDDRVAFNDDFDLYGATSNANFSNFSRSVRLDDAPPTEITIQSYPSAVADNDGNAYVAWADDRDFQPGVYYARILTNGTEPEALANHAVPGAVRRDSYSSPTLSISPDGAIYLAWPASENTPRLAFARAHAAGGGHVPHCTLFVAPSVPEAAGMLNVTGYAGDEDGISTLVSVSLALDGAPISPTILLPYFWTSIDVGALTRGPHNFSAVVTDRTGASGACDADFTITGSPSTNRPPNLNITSPPHGSSQTHSFTVEGEAADPEGQAVTVMVSLDGGPWNLATGAMPWSFAVDVSRLAAGAHTAAAIAGDGSLLSAPAILRFTVGSLLPSAPPTCEILYPPDGATVASNVEVTGRARDADGPANVARVEYRAFGGGASAYGEASGFDPFTFTLQGLPGGSSVLVNASVFDREGHRTECGAFYEVASPSASALTVAITSPANGTVVRAPFVVRGTASSSGSTIARVYIVVADGPLAPAEGTRDWSLTVDPSRLSAGTHTLVAYAVDLTGAWSAPAYLSLLVAGRDGNGTLLPWQLSVVRIETSAATTGVPVTVDVFLSNAGNETALGLNLEVFATFEGDAPSAIFSGRVDVTAGAAEVSKRLEWTPPSAGRVVLRAVINSDAQFPAEAILGPSAEATLQVAPQGAAQALPQAAGLFSVGLLIVAACAIAFYMWNLVRRRPSE